MCCISKRSHKHFFDTHIRINPPFATAVVQDRTRKEENNDAYADENNRPVQEHSTRSEMLEIEPNKKPLKEQEQTGKL